MISPSAPPKNSPESIQVGRILDSIGREARITLITTPVTRGWVRHDDTLACRREDIRVITPSLPFHSISQRLIGNHRFARFHVPDSDFWFSWFADYVVSQLEQIPDVIYSRSTPFSSAVLARRLKRKLNLPWMMHLSDPWSASPYRVFSPQRAVADHSLEAECFAEADMISLTTEGQARFYRSRFPDKAENIIVSSNMMPAAFRPDPKATTLAKKDSLRLIYTGALYRGRDVSTILSALRNMQTESPETHSKLEIHFYGNVDESIAKALDAAPNCYHHGSISYEKATEVQATADALLTIEPDGDHDLYLHFMPSKNLDYLAMRKPILAITPRGSETERLCKRGYGWAFSPREVSKLTKHLRTMVLAHDAGDPLLSLPDAELVEYRPDVVAANILGTLRMLASRQTRGQAAL